ncbi:hypothetical protein A1O7_09505 [Cladophialophora yegresii CBS 114405]|uniref:Uncharacterized protein n=1 Tax=Cladophialophora yegresii CBS 114405 TaxID=1182544 RepID=W9VFA9_9EURO|nr:uncharacterized protein A1O7_09505 [Cladophialophora yegresii CBS 114405]EXJ54168.1 hypothetical protein A1O7_09505 [Cladophialophora yegresii CBS 114405]
MTTTRRAASTNANSSSKSIVLEQPDKFRPPSHPARLNRPRRPPAAYNQGTTSEEKARQQHRAYPHMFPNQGTFMHWFLTDRKIHLWITMGTLTILACITMTQSFVRTSPYAHLLPSISSFPLHPIEYIRETLSVLRLHIEYETQRTNESRQQKILDAQKRRLYRRAHGLEDLNADEDQGIDVRGLVPWDDGLTNKERSQGGREIVLTGADMMKLGMQPGEHQIEFMKRLEAQGDGSRLRMVKEKGVDAVLREEQEATRRERAANGTATRLAAEGESGQEQQHESQPQAGQPEKRRRKLWLGIW